MIPVGFNTEIRELCKLAGPVVSSLGLTSWQYRSMSSKSQINILKPTGWITEACSGGGSCFGQILTLSRLKVVY